MSTRKEKKELLGNKGGRNITDLATFRDEQAAKEKLNLDHLLRQLAREEEEGEENDIPLLNSDDLVEELDDGGKNAL